MTKTIRRTVRLTVTPVTLGLLWLFVRFMSILPALLGGDHSTFEANMAQWLMWPSLVVAGAAGLAWWLAKGMRWEFLRTVGNECFSVYLSVFLGIVLTFIHARYDWRWYLAAAVPAIGIILLDREGERVWSRALRFTAIPVITLLTIHYACIVR